MVRGAHDVGELRAVADVLGHSPDMLMKVYAHALPESTRAIADRIGQRAPGNGHERPRQQEPPRYVWYTLEEALELLAALEDARDSLINAGHLTVVVAIEAQVRDLNRRLSMTRGEEPMSTEPLRASEAARRLRPADQGAAPPHPRPEDPLCHSRRHRARTRGGPSTSTGVGRLSELGEPVQKRDDAERCWSTRRPAIDPPQVVGWSKDVVRQRWVQIDDTSARSTSCEM